MTLILLWYGFIYYVFVGIFSTVALYISYKVSSSNNYYKYTSNSLMSTSIVSLFCYFFLTSLLILYYLLDYYTNFTTIQVLGQTGVIHTEYLVNYHYDYWFNANALSLNYVSIYYFPFIYIFLIVTFLSVAFCLSYNTNEVFSLPFIPKYLSSKVTLRFFWNWY